MKEALTGVAQLVGALSSIPEGGRLNQAHAEGSQSMFLSYIDISLSHQLKKLMKENELKENADT